MHKTLWAVVSFQSNAGNQISNARCSVIYIFTKTLCCCVPLSLQDLTKIDTPLYPDNRYEWLCNLANNQFQESDVYNGNVLSYLSGNSKK